jgi:uncharacterized protein
MYMGKPIVVQGDGYQIKGRIYRKADNDHPRPALLFLSGWNPGNQTWTTSDIHASYCARKLNVICMTIAFRGMGSVGNINTLTRADFLKDAITGYDCLAETEGVDRDRISIAGESFGAYMACILSTRRSVKSVALRVPTDFPDEGFEDIPQEKFAGLLSQEWKMQGHHFAKSHALQGLHDFQGKILLVASERDEFVPYQTTKNYLNAIRESTMVEYFMMKATGHALLNPIKFYKFMKFQSEWLRFNI